MTVIIVIEIYLPSCVTLNFDKRRKEIRDGMTNDLLKILISCLNFYLLYILLCFYCEEKTSGGD